MFYIEKLYYSPIKSISFNPCAFLNIKKNIGIENDRRFAFIKKTTNTITDNIQTNPKKRKIDQFLSLKDYPLLNNFNFYFEKNILILKSNNKVLLKTNIKDSTKIKTLCSKIQNIIGHKNVINLIENSLNPFFDSMIYGKIRKPTISLININSIKDFEKKICKNIDHKRFRANIYVSNMKAWEERNLINKTILINGIKFIITKEIPRCSVTNLKPNTSNYDMEIPKYLRKFYNNSCLGIYLSPLQNGKIKIKDKIKVYE